MLKLFLWLRYLRKKKIVLLSITAVALSSALLIVVASLFTSFINAFERSAVEAIGDIVLTPAIKFEKWRILVERLEQLGDVEAATPILSAQGLLHLGKGNVRAVTVWGIEPETRAKVTGFEKYLLRQKNRSGKISFEVGGSEQTIGGFVGIAVLAEPDEKTDEYDFGAIGQEMLGRKVVLITGTRIEERGEGGGAKHVRRRNISFTVSDIIFTGVYYFVREFVCLPIDELKKVLYPEEEGQVASQLQIKLAPGAEEDAALAQIRGVWEAFADEQLGWDSYLIRYTDIDTAIRMQSPLVEAFRKQMGILLLIFGVLSFSAVVLVFCIFYMIVMTRQRDIAVIKSCGTTGGSVAWIFLGFGAFVGVIGSGFGAVLGYIVTKNINTIEDWIRLIFGLKLWKSSAYIFEKIPNELNMPWTCWIIVLAIFAAALGALIPAVVAAKTKPVNILRYE